MTRQRDVCEVSAGVSVIGSSATVRTCGKPAVVAVREEHESPVVRCWTRGGRPSAGQEVGIGTCRAVFALDAVGGCRGQAAVAAECPGCPVEAPGGVGTGDSASGSALTPGRPRGWAAGCAPEIPPEQQSFFMRMGTSSELCDEARRLERSGDHGTAALRWDMAACFALSALECVPPEKTCTASRVREHIEACVAKRDVARERTKGAVTWVVVGMLRGSEVDRG